MTKTKGFTLIESLVALAIFSLVVMAGSTAFSGLSNRLNLERAAWGIRARLSQARVKSIWEGIPVRVHFNSSGCDLEEFDDLTKSWRTEERERLDGVRIEANNNPVFHPTGTVSNLATILVSNSKGRYKITLAISGRIRTLRVF